MSVPNLNAAQLIRNWLEKLEGETKGNAEGKIAKLKEVQMIRNDEQCQVIFQFHFTESLPRQIFDGSGTGTVTRSWQQVCCCFSSDNQLKTTENKSR